MPKKKGGGGYGNPPKEHQFKKGKSGNPAGRPKGAKNKRPGRSFMNTLTEMVLSEADRLLPLSERGERLELPTAQVILRRMVNDAVKGSHRAQREFLKMASAAENEKLSARGSMLEAVIDYRRNALAEIERCKLMELDPPDLVPHPDDIEICWQTGDVTIAGPVSVDERKQLEHWRSQKTAFEGEIEVLKDVLVEADDAASIALVERDIEQAERSLEMIRQIIQSIANQKAVSGG